MEKLEKTLEEWRAMLDPEQYQVVADVVSGRPGVEAVEEILRGDGLLAEGITLYAPTMVSVLHHVTQALRAHKLDPALVPAALVAARVLITQATEFMGPVFCEVFAEQGATVVASTDRVA